MYVVVFFLLLIVVSLLWFIVVVKIAHVLASTAYTHIRQFRQLNGVFLNCVVLRDNLQIVGSMVLMNVLYDDKI